MIYPALRKRKVLITGHTMVFLGIVTSTTIMTLKIKKKRFFDS